MANGGFTDPDIVLNLDLGLGNIPDLEANVQRLVQAGQRFQANVGSLNQPLAAAGQNVRTISSLFEQASNSITNLGRNLALGSRETANILGQARQLSNEIRGFGKFQLVSPQAQADVERLQVAFLRMFDVANNGQFVLSRSFSPGEFERVKNAINQVSLALKSTNDQAQQLRTLGPILTSLGSNRVVPTQLLAAGNQLFQTILTQGPAAKAEFDAIIATMAGADKATKVSVQQRMQAETEYAAARARLNKDAIAQEKAYQAQLTATSGIQLEAQRLLRDTQRLKITPATQNLTNQAQNIVAQIGAAGPSGADIPKLRGELAALKVTYDELLQTVGRAHAPFEQLFSRLGRYAQIAAGLTLVYGSMRAAMSGIDFLIKLDDIMAKISATMDGASERARNLPVAFSLIKQGTTQFGESLEKTGSLVFELNKALDGNEQLIRAAFAPALALITTGELDNAQTVRILVGLYKTLGPTLTEAGTPAEKFAAIADKVTKASFLSAGSAKDFLEALQFVSGQTSLTGESLDRLLAVLAVLQNSLLAGSRSGTSLARVFEQLITNAAEISVALNIPLDIDAKAKPLQFLGEVVKKLNQEVTAAGGVTNALAEKYSQLFGTIQGRRAFEILIEGYKDLDAAQRAVANSAGTAAEFLQRSSQSVSKSLEALKASFLFALDESISSVLGTAPGQMDSFAVAIRSASDAAEGLGRAFGAVAQAIKLVIDLKQKLDSFTNPPATEPGGRPGGPLAGLGRGLFSPIDADLTDRERQHFQLTGRIVSEIDLKARDLKLGLPSLDDIAKAARDAAEQKFGRDPKITIPFNLEVKAEPLTDRQLTKAINDITLDKKQAIPFPLEGLDLSLNDGEQRAKNQVFLDKEFSKLEREAKIRDANLPFPVRIQLAEQSLADAKTEAQRIKNLATEKGLIKGIPGETPDQLSGAALAAANKVLAAQSELNGLKTQQAHLEQQIEDKNAAQAVAADNAKLAVEKFVDEQERAVGILQRSKLFPDQDADIAAFDASMRVMIDNTVRLKAGLREALVNPAYQNELDTLNIKLAIITEKSQEAFARRRFENVLAPLLNDAEKFNLELVKSLSSINQLAASSATIKDKNGIPIATDRTSSVGRPAATPEEIQLLTQRFIELTTGVDASNQQLRLLQATTGLVGGELAKATIITKLGADSFEHLAAMASGAADVPEKIALALQKSGKTLAEYRAALQLVIDGLDDLAQSADELDLEKISNQTEQLIREANALEAALGETGAAAIAQSDAWLILNKAYETLTPRQQQFLKDLSEVKQRLKDDAFAQSVKDLGNELKGAGAAMNLLGADAIAAAKSWTQFGLPLGELNENQLKLVTNFALTTQALKTMTDQVGLTTLGYGAQAQSLADLIERQDAYIAKVQAGAAALEKLSTAPERLFQAQLDAQIASAKAAGDIGTLFVKAFQKATTAGHDLFTDLETLAKDAATNMTSSLSDLFFDIFTDRALKAGDIFKQFLNSMVRSLTNFLSTSVVSAFLRIFSGGGGVSLQGGGGIGGVGSGGGATGAAVAILAPSAAGGAGGGANTFNVQNLNVPGLGTLTSSSFWQGVLNVPSNWNAAEGLFGGLGNVLFGQAAGFSALGTLPANFAEISTALGGELAPALNSLVPAVESTQGLFGAGGGLASSISSFSVALAAVTVALNVYSGVMDIINGDTVKGGATLGGAAAGAGVGALIGLSQASWTFGSSVVIGAIIGAALGSSAGNLLGGLFGPGPPLTHEQRDALDAGKLNKELSPLITSLQNTTMSTEELVNLLISYASKDLGGTSSVAVVSQLRTPEGLAVIGRQPTDPALAATYAKSYPGGVISDPQRVETILKADPTALQVLVQRGLDFDKFLKPLDDAIGALVNAQISKADAIIKITQAFATDIPDALARILPPDAVDAFIHKLLDPIRAGFDAIKDKGPQEFLVGMADIKKRLEDLGSIATFVGGAFKDMNRTLDSIQGTLPSDLFTAVKTKAIDPFKQALIDLATSGRSLEELQPIFADASRQIEVLGGLTTLYKNINTEVASLLGDSSFLVRQSAKDFNTTLGRMSDDILQFQKDLGLVPDPTLKEGQLPKYGDTKDRDPALELLLLSNLHDAIIARYQFEQQAVQAIENSLGQVVQGVGQSLASTRISFASLEKSTTGSTHGFQVLNQAFKDLAQSSPSLVVKLYAIGAGIAAIIANVSTLTPAKTEVLAGKFAGGGAGLAPGENPFGGIFDSMLTKAKPFLDAFGTSVKAALDVGDTSSALGLLEKEKGLIISIAQGAIAAVQQWAAATIAVYQLQIDGLEKDKALIQDKIDLLEKEKRGIQDQIDAYSHQQLLLQRQIDAYSKQQTLLQRQITAYDKQEKVLQKQLTALDKQEKGLQNQIAGYDKQEKVLNKQLAAYDKDEKLLQKQLTGIDRQEKVLQKQLTAYEKDEKLLQKQLTAIDKQEKGFQQQIAVIDRQTKGLQQQIAVIDRQEKGFQQQIAAYDRDEKVLQRQIAGYDREEKALNKQIAAYDLQEKEIQKQLKVYEAQEKALNKQLDGYKQQEAALGKQSDALSKQETSLNKQLDAINKQIDLIEKFEAAITSLSDLIQSSLLGGVSPLSPTAKATQANLQYQSTLAEAQANPTVENAKLLEKAFQDRLTTSQAVLSRNSPQYQQLFFSSLIDLRNIQGQLKKQEPAGDLKSLKAQATDLEKQVEVIESQKEAIQAQIDAIQALEEPIQDQIDAIQLLKDGVQDQIDAIETLKEPIQSQIDAIDALKETVQDQIDAIELLKEPIQDQIDALELQKQPIQDQIDALELLKQPLQDQIDALELSKEPIQAQIDAIELLKEPIQAAIDALEESKGPIQDQIDAIELLKEPIQDQIDAIELLKEGIQDQIDAIELLKGPIQDQIDAIELLKDDIQDQIDAIELLKGPIQDQIDAIELLKQPLEDAIHAIELTERGLQDDIKAIDLIEKAIRADIELVEKSAKSAIDAITARLPDLLKPVLDQQEAIFTGLITAGNLALKDIIGDAVDAESWLGRKAQETVTALGLIQTDIATLLREGVVLKVNPNAAGTPDTFNGQDGTFNITGTSDFNITAPVTITAAAITVNGGTTGTGVDTHSFGGGGGGGQGGSPGGTAALGMPWVPRTMPVTVHPGEGILTPSQNQLWLKIVDQMNTKPANILPLAATGGTVQSTGTAIVHEGETIIPKDGLQLRLFQEAMAEYINIINEAINLFSLYSPAMGPDGRMYLGGWKDASDPGNFLEALGRGVDPWTIPGPDKIYASRYGDAGTHLTAGSQWDEPVLAFQKLGYSVNDPTFLSTGSRPTMLYTQLPNVWQTPSTDFAQHSIGRARLYDKIWIDQGENVGKTNAGGGKGAWLPTVATSPDGLQYLYYTSGTSDFASSINYRQRVGGAGRVIGPPEQMQFPNNLQLANLDVKGGVGPGWAMVGNTLDQSAIAYQTSDDGVNWSKAFKLLGDTMLARVGFPDQYLTPHFVPLSDAQFDILYGLNGTTIKRAGPFYWDMDPSKQPGLPDLNTKIISAQSGLWRTQEGLHYLHDNESVLNADQSLLWRHLMETGVLHRMLGRDSTDAGGTTSIELNIAPGAFQISGVSDPDAAARKAYQLVEAGIENGALGQKMRRRLGVS